MNNPPYPPAADDPDDDDGDLWFLPGPPEDEPAPLPPGPQAEEITEAAVLGDWQRAEAGLAARLARVAGRLGALDDRVRRGPEGWRQAWVARLNWLAR